MSGYYFWFRHLRLEQNIKFAVAQIPGGTADVWR